MPPNNQRHIALQTVVGETGCAGFVIVLLAVGGGLLLDFQITHLHPVFSIGLTVIGVPVALFWTIRRTLRTMERKPPQPYYVRNLALAAVAGQSGCATVILVFAALFAGMYLDSRLDTHPIFTIGLVVISVPLSLYMMVRMVLTTTARITPPPAPSRSVDSTSNYSQKEKRH
jgi:F0F1-type ATP synthase assembly protein I